MQFYTVNARITDKEWPEQYNDRQLCREKHFEIGSKTEDFNRKLRDAAYCFVDEMGEGALTGAILFSDDGNADETAKRFLDSMEISVADILTEETTFGRFVRQLNNAYRRDFIAEDDDDVLERFGLGRLTGRMSMNFGENILRPACREKLYSDSGLYLAEETLVPELDRIYSGSAKKRVKGHPVHYMIMTDDRDNRREMYRILLSALYENGRIRNKRYCFFDVSADDSFRAADLDCIYRSCAGGAVVVRCTIEAEEETDHASSVRGIAEQLCEAMRAHKNDVLTIFCFPRESTKIRSVFASYLGCTSFVEISEEFASGDRAEKYLKLLARQNKVRTDKKLTALLKEDGGYLTTDLKALFDEWYNRKLKTSVYPQYSEIITETKKEVKSKPIGSGYERLSEMIGLSEAKKVIDCALNYYKAQKLFAEKGLRSDKPAMHMIFTGNPGTAKTSVARLFAEIMKENGLLSKGTLVECGRGDLVGKFVGWTAPTIKRKFKEASGGVLFIDEAYSLVDDRDGSFGDEAINTIVQEMENHRGDVVVIFAGYPDKMERFMQKNPGLRSRTAFHVKFDDYSTDELLSIADLMADKIGCRLSADAKERLQEVFEDARTNPEFGNGRYVRNTLEKARMAQASRLLTMDFDDVTRETVSLICGEDIELPEKASRKKTRTIGFSA